MDQATGTVIAAVLGGIGTATASLIAFVMKGRKDRAIAELKVQDDLTIEYDKDLRARRIMCYEKLLSLMLPLAKYPEPDPLSHSRLRLLAINLRRWYFEGGGLYMSERTRDTYFDLQDGFRIVIQKRDRRWPQNANFETPGNLSTYLGRDDHSHKAARKLPQHLVEIANSQLNMSDAYVPEQICGNLIALGSSVRTAMTDDILTRRRPALRNRSGRNS
ncbi:MAG: hypothetical protein QOJ99_1601 [Bryobacterales bacterium]|nr:hypothetical protein [Bryobacterales bacterium]